MGTTGIIVDPERSRCSDSMSVTRWSCISKLGRRKITVHSTASRKVIRSSTRSRCKSSKRVHTIDGVNRHQWFILCTDPKTSHTPHRLEPTTVFPTDEQEGKLAANSCSKLELSKKNATVYGGPRSPNNFLHHTHTQKALPCAIGWGLWAINYPHRLRRSTRAEFRQKQGKGSHFPM